MTVIAEQLDKKLQTLDPRSASSLEKLVRDALELVESQGDAGRSRPLPPDFFSQISAEFGHGPFERPAQGELEKRQEW
jgi:hypothetical protein